MVIKYGVISDRIIYLVIEIIKTYSTQLRHCNAPTSTAQQELIEQLYEDIGHVKNLENTHYVIVTRGFNAKIGKRQPSDIKYIRKFEPGCRNDRRDMSANLLEMKNCFV